LKKVYIHPVFHEWQSIDSHGWLIISIIIFLWYNIALKTLYCKKGLLPAILTSKITFLGGQRSGFLEKHRISIKMNGGKRTQREEKR
jgi:hypothetical protein